MAHPGTSRHRPAATAMEWDPQLVQHQQQHHLHHRLVCQDGWCTPGQLTRQQGRVSRQLLLPAVESTVAWSLLVITDDDEDDDLFSWDGQSEMVEMLNTIREQMIIDYFSLLWELESQTRTILSKIK